MDPVADAINRLVGALTGQVRVTTTDPRREATIYNTGSGNISGTGTLSVWTVPAGRTYLLKGFVVTAVVNDTLAVTAGQAGLLYFYDDDDSDRLVAPIGAFDGDAAIGTWFNRDVSDLGAGVRGSAAGSDLKIKFGKDIAGGNIDVGWCVWGDEV